MPENPPPKPLLARAWYAAPVAEFVGTTSESVLGELVKHSTTEVTQEQTAAWLEQIAILQAHLVGVEGALLLEFNIPRMGRRVDAVLLSGSVVFVLEFKASPEFTASAVNQVWDYALDLKNFHEASHHAVIVPILIATQAERSPVEVLKADHDDVYRPLCLRSADLRPVIEEILMSRSGAALDAAQWLDSSYRPTPTIIEAARALYAQHSVDAIRCFDADAENLARTVRHIEGVVDDARANQRKVICFVTGVPGAGKTLVGLDIATDHRDKDSPAHAVFLSGNGPLVRVLREALKRDERARRKARGESWRSAEIGKSVESFIQNVHHFRDEGLREANAPHDHVAIFDEAQRAWNRAQTSSFMQRKRNRAGFDQSEPEFLISYMDRHEDWAVIVCLVGGGQEIHTGEEGISSWLNAIESSYPHWQCHISTRLTDAEYDAGKAIERAQARAGTEFHDSLHLAVSMRSFRAENVSAFVKALLDREVDEARTAFQKLRERYPIALTRDLAKAKQWVRQRARGSERYGLVASSKAVRLKPHAINVKVDVDPVHWFLNDRHDVRSSYYMEDPATEFQVQGLELDWVCVTWDGDLRAAESDWKYHDFKGSRWQNVRAQDHQQFMKNAYRVLLTRARQGMVIFVPPGDAEDPTRSPAYYDGTYKYLADLGLESLD